MTSLGGYLYYVIFGYNFSSKNWILFLKSKDNVFNMFKDFKALVQNQTRNKIKIPRINNGGEYISNDFKYFCKHVQIKRDLTVPYNAKKNGVFERNKMTTLEATKAMIHDQKLPMFLWGGSNK